MFSRDDRAVASLAPPPLPHFGIEASAQQEQDEAEDKEAPEPKKKSTGKSNRDEAMAICLQRAHAAKRAQEGNFTEAQARKVICEIAERSGMDAIEFATADKCLNEWVSGKEATKAKGTTVHYRHTDDSFIKFLGKRASVNRANIRPADIAAFRDGQVKEGKAQGTANMVVKTLRIAFNVARRQGMILTNPAEAVDLFDVGQRSRETFSRQQIADLLKIADDEWRGMILLGACRGLRLGDAARFTWENINAERQSLVFYPQKTARGANRKPEEYPMHRDLSDYINSIPICSDNPIEPLFPMLAKRGTRSCAQIPLPRIYVVQPAKATEGLTGSEVENVFIEALYPAFDSGSEAGEKEPTDLDIARVLTEFVPLSKLMAEQIGGLRTGKGNLHSARVSPFWLRCARFDTLQA